MAFEQFARTEEEQKRLNYWIKKKGLSGLVDTVKEKEETLAKLVKKHNLTKDNFDRNILPEEVRDVWEDFVRDDLRLKRSAQYMFDKEVKEKGVDVFAEEYESEFQGKVKTEEEQAEIQRKLDEAKEKYNTYGESDDLKDYVKANIELKGKTPEERLERQDDEQANTFRNGMENFKKKVIEANAQELARKEIKHYGYKTQQEALREGITEDSRLRSNTKLKPRRPSEMDEAIEARKTAILKEEGYVIERGESDE